MMKWRKSIARGVGAGLVAASLAVASLATWASEEEEEEVHLVDLMMMLQYFTHKTGLSLRAGNLELADFYLPRVQRKSLGEVGEVESYEGQPVGQLSGAMLGPSLHALEEAVDSGNPETALSAYTDMIDACNACHVATQFGFIKMEDRSTENPYMQSFGN